MKKFVARGKLPTRPRPITGVLSAPKAGTASEASSGRINRPLPGAFNEADPVFRAGGIDRSGCAVFLRSLSLCCTAEEGALFSSSS